METETKVKLKSELTGIQVQIHALDAMIGTVQAAASIPVMTASGPITTPGFTQVATVMKMQKDVMDKSLKFIEKLMEAI